MVETSYPKEINSFFTEIVDRVRTVLNPEYIIVAGSFGKKSWLYEGDELISDFEFVFVCKKRWSLLKKKKLLIDLNRRYDFDISLKGYLLDNVYNKIISNYSSKTFGYVDLNFFDTFSNPTILYSKNKKNLDVDINVSEIPVWEAWRLFVNRMGDLLSLKDSTKKPRYLVNYFWLKMFESMADTYLILNGIYEKSIITRSRMFSKQIKNYDSQLSKKCIESFKYIELALNSRREHQLNIFEIPELSIEERHKMVFSWMKYIENKLCDEESMDCEENGFIDSYANNSVLQKKYLQTKGNFSILLSNLLRLIQYKVLFRLHFKFRNINNSWRHLVLLSVAKVYEESFINKNGLVESKKLLKGLINRRTIDNKPDDGLLENVIGLWKVLR